jgi:hypothetical protein
MLKYKKNLNIMNMNKKIAAIVDTFKVLYYK